MELGPSAFPVRAQTFSRADCVRTLRRRAHLQTALKEYFHLLRGERTNVRSDGLSSRTSASFKLFRGFFQGKNTMAASQSHPALILCTHSQRHGRQLIGRRVGPEEEKKALGGRVERMKTQTDMPSGLHRHTHRHTHKWHGGASVRLISAVVVKQGKWNPCIRLNCQLDVD